jgi:hypothetical protein
MILSRTQINCRISGWAVGRRCFENPRRFLKRARARRRVMLRKRSDVYEISLNWRAFSRPAQDYRKLHILLTGEDMKHPLTPEEIEAGVQWRTEMP